jgi:hypothetical protein
VIAAWEDAAGLADGEEVSASLRAGAAVGLAGLLRGVLLGVELAEWRAVERLAGLADGPDGTTSERLRDVRDVRNVKLFFSKVILITMTPGHHVDEYKGSAQQDTQAGWHAVVAMLHCDPPCYSRSFR